MLKLYHTPGSCSLVVKTVLNVVGAEFDEENIDLANKPDDFYRVNPLGKVPALVVGDEVLLEGGAMLLWIDNLYPEAQLMPQVGTTQWGQSLRWLFFMYATMHPLWSMMFVPGRYGDEQQVREHAESLIHQYAEVVISELASKPYLGGDKPCLADYYLLVSLRWQVVLSQGLTERCPVLTSFIERMMADEKVALTINQDGAK